MTNFLSIFIKPSNKSVSIENHVVLTNSTSGDTMIHIWKGDNIDGAHSMKLNHEQAIKLRDALIGKFGV